MYAINNENLIWWDRKSEFLLLTSLKPYNDKANHCSMNLVLGSSSTILQLLFSILLFAQGWLKVGTRGMLNWV
jgi:hypothetical protein